MVEKKLLVLLLVLVLMSPAVLCYSESSKATYYGSPHCHGPPIGACGYGAYGTYINGGCVASVSRLYNHGLACGACYEIKCKAAECNKDGVKIVVTDHGASDEGDFILSVSAFARMARAGMENHLLAYGDVDIEYNRIPCQYHGQFVKIKIHEHSYYPHYLSFLFLYQGGMNDIIAVEIYEEASKGWRPCRKVYGAVWDMQNPPRGSLTVRFLVRGSAETKWIVLHNVIPATWMAGAVYDTSVQLY